MNWIEILGIASVPVLCLTAFINWQFRTLENRIDEKEQARADRDSPGAEGVFGVRHVSAHREVPGRDDGERAV